MPSEGEEVDLDMILGDDYQIGMHGFIGGEIDVAWVTRLLIHKGRRFDDVLIFSTREELAVEDGLDGQLVLDHAEFRINSNVGPVLLLDRNVPGEFDNPHAWVRDALDSVMFEVEDRVEDVSTILSEAEFWELIGALQATISVKSVKRLSSRLQKLSSGKLRKFRDTFVEKLFALDHPDNTVQMSGPTGDVVSADASLFYRCEIIARGRRAFEDGVTFPHQGGGDDGSRGEMLLEVAENAALDALPPPSVCVSTGSNRLLWETQGASSRVGLSSLSPGPFSREIQRVRLRKVPPLPLTFRFFLAYTVSPRGVRELIGCFMSQSAERGRGEVSSFLHGVLEGDDEVIAGCVIGRTGIDGPTEGAPIAVLLRRSTLSVSDYVARYRLAG